MGLLSGATNGVSHSPAKGETLTHAVARMRSQGYSAKQIMGQVSHWHPDWTPEQIQAVVAPHVTKAKAVYHGTSTKPFFPGQKPDHEIFAGRAGEIPVYTYGNGHPGSSGDLQTILGGAPKGKSLQQSQVDLAHVYRQNHPVGQQIIEGVANAVPGVAVAKGLRDSHLNVGTVANEALNDITSGLLPAGKGIAIIGGMKGLKTAVDAADVAKAADAAEKVAKGVPEEASVIRGAMKGAKIARGKQEALYSAERKARVAKANEHLSNASLDPEERIRLAKSELKGELPKINFKGMSELNEDSIKVLQSYILDHPHLLPFQKINASDALTNALGGKVPTRSEIQLLTHVFGKETAHSIGKVATHPLREMLLSLVNVPRSLMASFDMSAPFRQGLVAATRHPMLFARNFKPMIKAFGSEKVYQSILEDIHARPTYPMMMEAKLALTELPKKEVGAREEQFASDLAEKIPVLGKGVRASGRAYTGYLDKLRADVFDHLLQRAESQGINVQDQKFLKDLGRLVNDSTGRGDLGKLQEAGKVANALFFSPRLLASRMNIIFAPLTYAKADPFVRKEALKSMIGLAGTLSTILALAAQVKGVKVVTDPRNPDWGKIKIHNTRIDIAGGFQQPLRLFAQLATGTAISSTTGKAENLTAGGFGQPTRLDLFMRFWEGKEAPVTSIATDWLRNSSQIGQKFSWGSETYSHLVPLLAQDSYDLYNDRKGGMNGIAAAFAGYGLGAFGFGLQTYAPTQPKGRQPKDPLSGGGLLSTGGSGGFSSGGLLSSGK